MAHFILLVYRYILIELLLFFLHPMQVEHQGYAAHYNIGLMEKVSRNREMDVVDCMIASPFHSVGTWVYVKSNKNNRIKLCRVTDVAQPKDRTRIIQRGIIAELDFTSAKELCNISRVNEAPPKQCPITTFRKVIENATSYYRVSLH